MLILITIALVTGSVLRTMLNNRRLRENGRAWAELQGRLIDKFGNAGEVVRYLESDSSRHLLSGQEDTASSPQSRVLDAVHLGLLVLAGGVGFSLAGGVGSRQIEEVLRVFGILGIVLGIGFLASAGISWALLRSWGLFGARNPDETV
jgi:hypothetical protein